MRTFPFGLSYFMSPGRSESPGVTLDLWVAARRSASQPTKASASIVTMKILRKVSITVFYTPTERPCRRFAISAQTMYDDASRRMRARLQEPKGSTFCLPRHHQRHGQPQLHCCHPPHRTRDWARTTWWCDGRSSRSESRDWACRTLRDGLSSRSPLSVFA
jgi:hypothetical protein